MDSTAISTVLVVNFLLFSAASAFNITKLLGKFPDYSQLNDLLTRTNLAGEINDRSTITVLGLDNGAVSSLSSQPIDVMRRILSVHIILDYYDKKKLENLSSDNITVLPTLFQASGGAVNQQGFIKIVPHKNGDISFGSNVKGAQADSNFVKQVAVQPYDISLLQISSPIQVPGIDTKKNNTTPPPPPPKAPSPADSPKIAPAPSTETPSDAPAAKSPKADAESPVVSPPNPDSDSPTAADVPAPGGGGASDESGASRVRFVGAAAVVAVISWFVAL